MSFPTRPTIPIPVWDTTATNVTQPNPAAIQFGFPKTPGQNYGPIPPYQWENYMKNATGIWLQYADQALSYLSQNNITSIVRTIWTAGGNFTVQPNLVICFVEVQAGGGGSGGANTSIATASAGSGGGGGEYGSAYFTPDQIGSNTQIIIGVGGFPGDIGGSPAGFGGDSIFGAGSTYLLSAAGGAGGAMFLNNSSTNAVIGGLGGFSGGSGGRYYLQKGGNGGTAYFVGSAAIGGDGGTSVLGTPGRGAITINGGGTPAPIYSDSIGFGAGAPGPASLVGNGSEPGAQGLAGVVITTEFIAG